MELTFKFKGKYNTCFKSKSEKRGFISVPYVLSAMWRMLCMCFAAYCISSGNCGKAETSCICFHIALGTEGRLMQKQPSACHHQLFKGPSSWVPPSAPRHRGLGGHRHNTIVWLKAQTSLGSNSVLGGVRLLNEALCNTSMTCRLLVHDVH